MSAIREGDWTCAACNNHNYASRAVCNRCGSPNVAKIMPTKVGGDMREGDWMCGQCGNHNYASRQACNRCEAPKPSKLLAYGAAKMMQEKHNRLSPYLAPAMSGKGGMRPGDWMCPSCSNINYAMRTACNRCGGAKPTIGFPMGGFGLLSMQSAAGQKLRAGDWICRACNNHNYAIREACNKCNVPKSVYIAKSGMRDGDWMCPGCHNHNFADKTSCNKCQLPKSDDATYKSVPKKGLREGDWVCPSCNNHNYASRENCNRCGAAKNP